MSSPSSSAQQGGNESFVPVNASDTVDTPTNALSGSTFGSPVFEDGAFQFGPGDTASGAQSASPSVSSGIPSLGGFALSLPTMLLLAGAVLLVVYLVKRHG
jgi:hypothetical protein